MAWISCLLSASLTISLFASSISSMEVGLAVSALFAASINSLTSSDSCFIDTRSTLTISSSTLPIRSSTCSLKDVELIAKHSTLYTSGNLCSSLRLSLSTATFCSQSYGLSWAPPCLAKNGSTSMLPIATHTESPASKSWSLEKSTSAFL